MEKYYRVIKDNFLWEEGAILKESVQNKEANLIGYQPIEEGVWDATKHNGNEYISSRIVENNPKWFERVYPSSANKALFVTAAELKKFYNKFKK